MTEKFFFFSFSFPFLSFLVFFFSSFSFVIGYLKVTYKLRYLNNTNLATVELALKGVLLHALASAVNGEVDDRNLGLCHTDES